MQEYIHRSGNANFKAANLNKEAATVGIVDLMGGLLLSDWSLIELLTPYVNLYYQFVPYYASETNYNLYRPFTVYHNNKVIGYYNPNEDEPGQTPGYTIYWYPAPSSPSQTLQHTITHLWEVDPLATGEIIDGGSWAYGMKVSYPFGGPTLNNQHFAPDPANGIGGITEYGGCYLQSKSYNDTHVKLSIYWQGYSTWIAVDFGGGAPIYIFRLGGYIYDCYCNPYQLIMIAQSGTGWTGDVASGSTSFLASMPFIPVTLQSALTYAGVCSGGLYKNETYTGGSFNLNNNRGFSRARLNSTFSPKTDTYAITDSGLFFPLMYCDRELVVVNGGTEVPQVNPAYVSFSASPADVNSLGKVIGNLWDSFIVSKELVLNDIINLAGKEWYCVTSQPVSILGQTPASLCVLKED